MLFVVSHANKKTKAPPCTAGFRWPYCLSPVVFALKAKEWDGCPSCLQGSQVGNSYSWLCLLEVLGLHQGDPEIILADALLPMHPDMLLRCPRHALLVHVLGQPE